MAAAISACPGSRRSAGWNSTTISCWCRRALDGQGIALGGGRLAEDFIARGTLVRPINATLRSSRGFYLLVPHDVPLSQPAKLFRDWIVGEAKGGRKGSIKSVA